MKAPSAEEFIWAAWLVGVAPQPGEAPESYMHRCGAAFMRYDEWCRNPGAILWEDPYWIPT